MRHLREGHIVAFTIGAPGCSAQRKHIALRPADMMSMLLGRTEQLADARERSAAARRRSAAALATLPETYVVFNGFRPVSGPRSSVKWGVDHVVIGPSGVFAIGVGSPVERRVLPASVSRATEVEVLGIQRHAAEFRHALTEWSRGTFGDVFVKPVLVYAQDRAYVEKLQEGPVKVIPLRWLITEVTERTFEQLTPDHVFRIAQCLFEQLPVTVQRASKPELDRLGVIAQAWLDQQAHPQLMLPIALD